MAQLSFRDDARLSTEVRQRLRSFCESLGEDLIALAKDLGLSVFGEEMMPYESGYLEYAPTCGSKSKYRIVVNQSQSIERQRFTVAHELAHFLLHRDSEDFFVKSETRHRSNDLFEYLEPEDKYIEREANAFAAAILMPQNLLRPAFERLSGNVSLLAKLFQVSEAAMNIRLKDMRLTH